MKVALTYPYCWPEVRRGGERLFHDLASYLVSAGVDVTSVTARSSRSAPPLQPGPVSARRALPDLRLPRGMTLDRPVTYLPGAALSVGRVRPDLVHGLFHLDGVAARLARPLTGRVPYIVHVQGMPRAENLRRLRVHNRLFPPSIRRAEVLLAVSRAAAAALEDQFGLVARPFHNGVYTAAYSDVQFEDRSAEPVVFFPADPGDPRKRIEVLADAMAQLEPRWSSCRLAVAGRTPPDLARRLTARLGARVDFLGVLDERAMVRSYARAWVTCLPAVQEAFGLVVVESLAAGRPCVGIRDAGVPEILGPASPWLAEPDDASSLAGALSAALARSEDPGSVEQCRRLGRPFDWDIRGLALLDLYRQLAGR